MGNRREPRKPAALPVRIFGTDRDGKIFSENVVTIDVSQSGVKLGGVRAKLTVDEVIGLAYGANKVHFKIKWLGAPGTPAEGTVGLLNLTPEKPLWDFLLPRSDIDVFVSSRNTDRRRWPRVKCSISVELRPAGKPIIWGKASDLSQGGCFIEMSIPLPVGTKFDVALWLNETKLPLQGEIVSLAPGFGNGVRFLNVSAENQNHLSRFIQSITPARRAPIANVKHFGV